MALTYLPGAELIEKGLADLTAGFVTIESLLVSIAAPGLRDVGLAVGQSIPDAERQRYALLAARDTRPLMWTSSWWAVPAPCWWDGAPLRSTWIS